MHWRRASPRLGAALAALLLLLLAASTSTASQVALSSSTTTQPQVGGGGEGDAKAKVIELTDDNFDALTADGEWAIVVYAPWCVHCQALKPTWAALAGRLDGAVRVAQVDGTKQRALASRFRVEAYPSIYLLRPGGETYDYESGPRTEDALADFALGGWRSYDPAPFWRSPHGAWGRAAGAALAAPDRLAASYARLHRERGWPALAAVAALLAWPVAAGLAGIGLLDFVCTRRAVAAAKEAAARAAAAAAATAAASGPAGGEAGAEQAAVGGGGGAAAAAAAEPAAARPHAD